MKKQRRVKGKILVTTLLIVFLFSSMSFLKGSEETKVIKINLLIRGLEPYIRTKHIQNYPVGFRDFSDFEVEFLETRTEKDPSNEGLSNALEENLLAEYEFEAYVTDTYENPLYKADFSPFFIELTDPPIEKDESVVEITIPYNPLAKYLKVYYLEEEKLSIDLQNLLCNNNQICEENENYLSCSDCNFYAEDGLCFEGINPVLNYWNDHYCDPDCYKDDDCQKENCNDKIKNQDETSTDKGGVCNLIFCDSEKEDQDCNGNVCNNELLSYMIRWKLEHKQIDCELKENCASNLKLLQAMIRWKDTNKQC